MSPREKAAQALAKTRGVTILDEVDYRLFERDAMSVVTAYLAATVPPEIAELVERLRREATMYGYGQDNPTRILREAADALIALSAKGAGETRPVTGNATAALRLLLDRVDKVLGQLGPGGYLLPAGAGLTNSLESAANEARNVLAASPAPAPASAGQLQSDYDASPAPASTPAGVKVKEQNKRTE